MTMTTPPESPPAAKGDKVVPRPPPIMTPATLAAMARNPNLPRNTWYLVAATTLSLLNRPDEIPAVYQHAIAGPSEKAPESDEQQAIIRRMREGLIKAAAVGGIPKTINALAALRTATPPHLLDGQPTQVPTARFVDMYQTAPSEVLRRGQDFFNRVYGKVASRVMSGMDQSGTPDLGLVARLVYSYIISNTDILSQAETSFVMIAALIPQDVNPQLKGHLRGALNGGATVEEVRAVREVAIHICEASGMRRLEGDSPGGWGWRDEVANL